MKLSTLAVMLWVAPAHAAAAAEKSTCEDFNSGVYLGYSEAENLWDNRSCSAGWGFQDEVNDMLRYDFPTSTSNWRTNSCNRGVAQGAQQFVDHIEEECYESSPDECNDLGVAAAQEIAFSYCPFSGASDEAQPYGRPNYKESCRQVAYGVCQGKIKDEIGDRCYISTSKLRELQNDCYDQVDSMTGGASFVVTMTRHLRKVFN